MGYPVPSFSKESQINHAAEAAELERVLTSRAFSRAPNLCRILAYVCQQSFSNTNPQPFTEYSIAVEALGRKPDFSPLDNSIVRVEFSRLRKRLQEYYATEGASNPIQIHLPETGYTPRFLRPERDQARTELDGLAEIRTGRLQVFRFLAQPTWKPIIVGLLMLLIAASLALLLVRYHARAGLGSQTVTGPRSAPSSSRPPVGLSSVGQQEIRIRSGSLEQMYMDVAGHSWIADRYFQGGAAITRPGRRIYRTLDPTLYRTAREGDFQYDIPLKPGVYELRLHFAEIVLGDQSLDSRGEGARRFNVTLNDKPLLTNFDIVSDANGQYTADERVFKSVSPAADGFLHLNFSSSNYDRAVVNGIEITPGMPGKLRPIRILCATSRVYYDRNGQLWGPDRYFLGGRAVSRSLIVENTAEPEVYSGERWGHFSYAIPAPPGTYTVTLRFAEANFGIDNFGSAHYNQGGIGSRLFDISCNDMPLLRDFDIFREAGGPNRAVEKKFHGLKPNAQGKLLLNFVPVKDYATVRAIEVTDEGLEQASRQRE